MIRKLHELQRKSSLPQPTLPKTSRSTARMDDSYLPSMNMSTTNLTMDNLKYLPPLRSLTNVEDNRNTSINMTSTNIDEKPSNPAPETKEPESEGKIERVKLPIYQNITDIKDWKKRHKLDPKVKVYIVTGGYGDIKKALDKRGWIQNPDPKSRCFDLKWTIKSNEAEIPYLEEFQLVNHFEKNATITTKAGLCKNLKNLIWFSNVDIDTFYPKCYDLNDEKDYEDFQEEFKFNKAESILKLYEQLCAKGEFAMAKEMEETVNVAMQVCEKKIMDLDEMLEIHGEIQPVKITEEEWKIISKDEISLENLAKKKYEARLSKYEKIGKAKKKSTGKKKGKRTIIDAKSLKNKAAPLGQVDQNVDAVQTISEKPLVEEKKNELLEKVQDLISRIRQKNPQSGLIGDKNIWMMKPAGLSRGRGITCMKNLIEILDLAKKSTNPWVVQKYIENPLIIHKRKFDIRQWVLVTDWNPLTVWFYEECYVRFSGDEYNPDDLENKFVHLTNNSVTKHQKAAEDPRFEQNMWRMETFQNHLKERFGRDVFEEVLKPKMKQIVTWSLESVQDMIENKKNSFELYGYDFMVDEDLNVWLIEINLSPSLDYSTPVTKRLVKMVSEDVIKVVVDYGMAKKKKKVEVDTGLFTCTHKSRRCVDKPMKSFGLDLVCEGSSVEKLVMMNKGSEGEKNC